MCGTYTMVYGERIRIKDYMTKAAYQHKIDGLTKAVAILTERVDYETNKVVRKIASDYTNQIEKLTIKRDKTRY